MNTFLFTQNAIAQKKKGLKVLDEINLRNNEDEEDGYEYQYIFPNINKIPFYNEPLYKSQIKFLEEQQEYKQLAEVLSSYISNFGIQNFYKETDLIWKLAQIREILGDTDEALFLYRLVLKHHRGSLTKIKQHYDTLNQNKEDLYVPLKHYYELVEYRKAVDTLRPPRNVFTNMGPEVNSKAEDYAPTLSIDNNMLIFTSRRNKSKSVVNHQPNEDLYFSNNYDNYWDEAKPFKELNTPYNEGSACISRDGRTLFFSRCDAPDGFGNCDLYVSYLNDDGIWSKAENLGINVNSKGWDSQPSLSHEEDTLYFASDRIGGFGLADIYFTAKDKKTGKWGRAQNIGPIINTRENEASPFMHPIHDVLYFSSTGHLLRFGSFDIYKSRKLRGQWQEPKNIGPLVNGKGSEYYFAIDANSKNLYYARSEEKDINNLDLFSFPLPMEAHPEANTRLEGSLEDSLTGKPFKGIVTVIDMTNGIEVAPKELRADGSYSFDLIDDADYLLVIQGEEFFRVEKKIHLSGDTMIRLRTPSIKFKRLQFASLNFENGKANILPAMHADLDKLFNYLLDNPEFRLVISGHTDADGDPKANIDLSQRRADAIKKYLTNGDMVESQRVTAIGFGSSKPLREEKSAEDKKVNRRVEFQIIRPEDEH